MADQFDVFKARTVDEATEMAVVDAYDEYEMASGWACCLEEVGFVGMVAATGDGKRWRIKQLTPGKGSVSARCEGVNTRGTKSKRFQHLAFEGMNPIQRLWAEAFDQWAY